MKKFSLFLLIATISLLTFTSEMIGPSKCSGEEEYSIGLKKLGNYQLLKDYRISLKKGSDTSPETVMHQVSLTKGLKYRFYTVNSTDNKTEMILNLYAQQNKQILLGTTYHQNLGKHYPSMEFVCQTSGTYYLFVSFDKNEKGCGVAFFTTSK